MSQCEGEKNNEIQNSFQTYYIFFAKDWVVDELYFLEKKHEKYWEILSWRSWLKNEALTKKEKIH